MKKSSFNFNLNEKNENGEKQKIHYKKGERVFNDFKGLKS